MAFPILITSGNRYLDGAIIVLGSVIAVLCITQVFTEIRFWVQSRGNGRRFQGKEPLTLPYAVPWLGGFYRMLSPNRMYEYACTKSPQGRPVKLRIGPLSIYVIFGAKNIKTIMNSPKVFNNKANAVMAIRGGGGMFGKDLEILSQDKSGHRATPLIEIPPGKRIWKKTHDLLAVHLSAGAPVELVTSKFMKEFNCQLELEPKNQPRVVPLFEFVKNSMLIASVTALLGTEILRLNPDFVSTYWEFEETFVLMVAGAPKALYPRGYAARSRMQRAVKAWLSSAWQMHDRIDAEEGWEKNFGSRYMRKLVEELAAAGISPDGQASNILPLIWGINSNSIPTAVWAVLETAQRPDLWKELREEVSASKIRSSVGEMTIDVAKLVSKCPLLSSIYLESMRCRNSVTLLRQINEDLELDGYVLREGSFIMAPVWLPNQGELWDVAGHSAKEFWPKRFIEMPKIKPSNPDEKSQFEIATKQENFFQYGGGGMICPGRLFAKQEIMAAIAHIVMKFDIQAIEWVTLGGKKSSRPAKPDEGYAGAGILPPDRDLMVKLSRIE